ncbi:MAG: hypothetical protein ACRDHZ_23325 [Ktedonobacteraceae bacterium]
MAEALSYDYLWQACQKEKQTNQLLLVPKTFYDDIAEYINSLPAPGPNEADSCMKANSIKLLNEIFERRKQKIMLYVAYNKQLPQPISNLELEFYNRLTEVARATRLEHQSMRKSSGAALRSLKDIPEIILPSGNKIGPLKKDQVLEMRKDSDPDIEFLTKNMICERL